LSSALWDSSGTKQEGENPETEKIIKSHIRKTRSACLEYQALAFSRPYVMGCYCFRVFFWMLVFIHCFAGDFAHFYEAGVEEVAEELACFGGDARNEGVHRGEFFGFFGFILCVGGGREWRGVGGGLGLLAEVGVFGGGVEPGGGAVVVGGGGGVGVGGGGD